MTSRVTADVLARLAGLDLTADDLTRLDGDLDRLLVAIDALPPADPDPPEAPIARSTPAAPPPPIAVALAPCHVPRVIGEP